MNNIFNLLYDDSHEVMYAYGLVFNWRNDYKIQTEQWETDLTLAALLLDRVKDLSILTVQKIHKGYETWRKSRRHPIMRKGHMMFGLNRHHTR